LKKFDRECDAAVPDPRNMSHLFPAMGQ